MNNKRGKSECSICCEERELIECPECKKEVCKKCTKKHILSGNIDPSCAHCGVGFSRYFLQTNISESFLKNDYKTWRERVVFDRHMSRLPGITQRMSEVKVNKETTEKFIKEIIPGIQKSFKNGVDEIHKMGIIERPVTKGGVCMRTHVDLHESLKNESWKVHAGYMSNCERYIEGVDEGLFEPIQGWEIKDGKLWIKRREKFMRSHQLWDNYPWGFSTSPPPPAVKFKCPKCNGFIVGEECPLCQTKVCEECMCVKEEEGHKCSPDIVSSIKLIKNDSISCPKCCTTIYRISGCDSMFCTNCKCAFCYKTGQITTREIHNPHYFEYINTQGGTPQGDTLESRVKDSVKRRFIQQARHYVTQRRTNERGHLYNITRNLIRYLRGEISKEKLEEQLQRIEKGNLKTHEVDEELHVYGGEVLKRCEHVSVEELEKIENETQLRLDEIIISYQGDPGSFNLKRRRLNY